jgi:N-acetylgalactosamine-N,N'-diacetylbacillosaminyl-diphospho-undecaprenol 4-alpha-N-acetylgalactosaminyltransferase
MNAILINSLADGGAEKVALTVLESLVKRGHHIKLICLEKNQYYEIPNGVEVIYLSNATGYENGLIKLLNLPVLAFKLMKWVRQYHIQVIQSHLFRANYVNVLAKLMGANHRSQLVNTGSITAKYSKAGIAGKLNLLLIRCLYPKSDCLITKSKGMIEDLNNRFQFFVPKAYIYNPTQLNQIQSKQKEIVSENEFQFNSQRRYIITMARMNPQKCLDILIHAFAIIEDQFDDTDLVFLGDGKVKQKLQEITCNLKLGHRIFFPGRVKNPYKYLIRAKLFVLPSATEGFPNSLIDAMACKLPVISTDCMSGPREILAPETDITLQNIDHVEFATYGVLVPVKNHLLLAEAIKKMLDDESLSKHYATKGYERACMFELDKIIDQYEKVFIQEKYVQE